MRLTRLLLLSLAFLCLSACCLAADFAPVTPEELKMTSVPEQPGASAVILFREEIDDDMNNLKMVHERIKILTDAGRQYANVEIPYSRRAFTIGGIAGRTTHPDGTVVPFEGKPFDKTVVKRGNIKVNVKSFTLPDVQVGSVIEFRYERRYDDRAVFAPEWEVQTELFQRKAYFKFIPFQNRGNMEIRLAHGQISTGIAWAPFLGCKEQPQLHRNAGAEASYLASTQRITHWVDLSVNNVPAFVEEPDMPPASIIKWRVYFYYQENLKADDYWKAEGKYWNKDVEGFLGKDHGISAALSQILAPTDTPDQKVHKIYAFVSGLENQDYIPERTAQENKVLNLKENKGAEDVLEHRSGTHDELNRLFVAMVRAAGIPAALMWVPDRSREIFIKQYLDTRQMDAEVAIVKLDGKDVFLDPGSKFCPYGILAWQYTGVMGLRQSDKGAEESATPDPTYKQSFTTRVANLSVGRDGAANGTIALMFKGIAAMEEREEGGRTDADGRKKLLEDALRAQLPGNSEVSLTNEPDWNNAEAPLTAQFKVSFPFAIVSGKRVIIPQHLFQIDAKNRFTSGKRINAIYFHYPWQEADEVHITLPPGTEVESLAPDDKVTLPYALYQVHQKQESPGRLFSRRDFIMGQSVFTPDKYSEVKGFFDKVKTDDDQPLLVKVVSNVASTN